MSKVKLSVAIIALVSATSGSWCGPQPECKLFVALAPEERRTQFRGYSVEKQLDAYLCAMRQEPPDLTFANQIADRGESAIPLVIQKLKATKNESDQENLIYLLEVMSDRGHLRGRKDVVAEVSQTIDAMKIEPVRKASLESLKKIETNSGIKPFTYAP